jgi:hypothetical protein
MAQNQNADFVESASKRLKEYSKVGSSLPFLVDEDSLRSSFNNVGNVVREIRELAGSWQETSTESKTSSQT